MTVLIREELNEADLAWAAGDPGVAAVMGQVMQARSSLSDESPFGAHAPFSRLMPRDRVGVDPAILRARGAL